MEVFGASLASLGAVCLVAAIVGGDVQLPGGTKFGVLKHRGIRWLLAGTACLFLVVGFLGMTSSFPRKDFEAGGDRVPALPASNGGTVTTPAPKPPVTTTPVIRAPDDRPAASYRQSANAACNEARKRTDAGPQPVAGDAETIAAFALYFRDTLQAVAIDLAAIEVPGPLRSRHEAMAKNLSDLSAAYGSMGFALQHGNSEIYERTLPRVERFTDMHRHLVTELGLSECALM